MNSLSQRLLNVCQKKRAMAISSESSVKEGHHSLDTGLEPCSVCLPIVLCLLAFWDSHSARLFSGSSLLGKAVHLSHQKAKPFCLVVGESGAMRYVHLKVSVLLSLHSLVQVLETGSLMSLKD